MLRVDRKSPLNILRHASFFSRSLNLLAFGFFLSGLSLVSAGAWTPEKGAAYLKFSGSIFESFANFNLDGDRFEPFEDDPDQFSRFREESFALYYEYGLLDRLAIFGSFTYKDIGQRTRLRFIDEDITVNNQGFADVDLGVRYRLTEGPNVFSISALAKLPYLYDEDDDFKLGNAQEDIELRGLFGRGLGSLFYMGLEAAYRWRLDAPSDEYRYLAELGFSAPKYVYARTKLDGIVSRGEFQRSSSFGNPTLNPQFDLTKLELTIGFSLTKLWHLEYTYTDTLSGKNTAEGSIHQYAVIVTF